MKSYDKPRLMVLSVSANDALCGSCTKGTRYAPIFQQIAPNYGNKDNVLEYGEGLFGDNSDCEIASEYDGYCKFTSVEDGMTKIFTS